MSSYLTFYLLPKKRKDQKEDPKPMTFISYSRSSDIYQAFYEELNPVYVGIGDTPNYSDLTPEDVRRVIDSLESDLKKAETNLNLRVEAYKKMTSTPPDEAIQDYVDTESYIAELRETINTLEDIHFWVSDLEYSDFEKVLINIS